MRDNPPEGLEGMDWRNGRRPRIIIIEPPPSRPGGQAKCVCGCELRANE